jgi:cytochrome P450
MNASAIKAPYKVAASRSRPLRGIETARHYIHFFRDPITCMRRLHQKHGDITILEPILAYRTPPRLHVLTVGPYFNQQVLGDPILFRTTGQTLRGPADSSQRRLRFGLTRMQGTQHKQQRQMVMPPFHRKAVESYHGIMVNTVARMLDGWQVGSVCGAYCEMRKLAMVLASTILFSPDPSEFLEVGTMIEEWLRRNFSANVWLFPVNLPGTPYRGMLNHASKLEELILSMISQRRANPHGRIDVLSLLTQARDEESVGMSDAELVGQTTILFGASYETTASTLTWTLFLLSQHPTIMLELVDELDRAFRGRPPEAGELRNCHMLERVIKESMRILPPVPYTIRAATAPAEIGGYRIPKGSRVICSHFLTHHQPELYPEPEKFRPDRWLAIEPSQYEYMPFSAGPRTCIGANFAMQALKISLSMILQRFRLQVVTGKRIDPVVRVTMRPCRDIPMKIFRQDRQFSRVSVGGTIRDMVELT